MFRDGERIKVDPRKKNVGNSLYFTISKFLRTYKREICTLFSDIEMHKSLSQLEYFSSRCENYKLCSYSKCIFVIGCQI